jgi:hypothetical protein
MHLHLAALLPTADELEVETSRGPALQMAARLPDQGQHVLRPLMRPLERRFRQGRPQQLTYTLHLVCCHTGFAFAKPFLFMIF